MFYIIKLVSMEGVREDGEKQEVVEQQSILGRSSIKGCNQSISHSLLPWIIFLMELSVQFFLSSAIYQSIKELLKPTAENHGKGWNAPVIIKPTYYCLSISLNTKISSTNQTNCLKRQYQKSKYNVKYQSLSILNL